MARKRRHACAGSHRPAAPSTKRLRGEPTAPAPAPPRQPLPVDLLLEIAARADVVALVRCAAAKRSLRRDILDPAFRRRRLAVRAAASGGFDPTLLLALTCRHEDTATRIARAHAVYRTKPSQRRPRVGIDHGLLESLEPAASRDGLHVLCGDVLSVYDSLSCETTSLPPRDVSTRYPPPALLAVGADRSFEVLVTDTYMRIQTFSSRNGKWSAVRAVARPTERPLLSFASPVVLGRTVHWLSMEHRAYPGHVVALDVDAAAAATVRLPSGYRDWMAPTIFDSNLLLVVVACRVSLLVSERLAVSMWSLTTEATTTPALPSWSRQVVIGTQAIQRIFGLCERSYGALRMPGPFLAFGERSGTVILRMNDGEAIRLNIGTKEVTTFCRYRDKGRELVSHVCLHEIDLVSLLQAMKSF